MTIPRTSEEAMAYKKDFLARVQEEFGTQEELDEIIARAKDETGGDHVYLQTETLATKLAREGYLVTPHIGRTRFSAKLQPKDVGLDASNPEHKKFIDNYLYLGNKLLIPSEILSRLDRIEGRIRRVIEHKYGIPTCNGTFVPYKVLDNLKEEVEALKKEYFDIRDEILANYDGIRSKTEQEYRKFAKEVFQLVMKDPYYEPTEKEVEQFVFSTMSYFPRKSEVEKSFYVTLDIGVVTMTAELLEHEKRLELVKKAEEKYQRELDLLERELSEAIRVQKYREAQKLQLERERYKTKIMAEKKKQTAIKAAINQSKEEYLPQMQEIISDLAGAVHGIVYDAVSRVNESIAKHGSLTSGSSKSLRRIIERVQNLCVVPDPDVNNWIKEIQQIIDIPATKRNKQEVKDVINEIQYQAGSVILELGTVPRTLRNQRKITIDDIEKELSQIPVTTGGMRQIRNQSLFEDIDEGFGGDNITLERAKRAC